MSKLPRLADDELRTALATLPGWRIEAGKLRREYRFADFVTAWGFMTRAALIVQAMDHHPEWSNVYDRVTVELVTHDSGGITRRDVELAAALERLAGQ